MDLGCHEGRRANLVRKTLARHHLPTDTEVAKLDLSILLQEQVVRLDVSVCYLHVVAVFDRFTDLLKQVD